MEPRIFADLHGFKSVRGMRGHNAVCAASMEGMQPGSEKFHLMLEHNQFRFDSLDLIQRPLKIAGFRLAYDVQNHNAAR